MSERLDKIVARALGLSRQEAQKRIRAGRVLAACAVCRDPGAKVGADDAVCVDGRAIGRDKYVYLMMNKPAGYLSATEDKRAPTVMALLPERYRRSGLSIAGRLDKDSEGLLLLTNDGALNHGLTAPRRDVRKRYAVTLDAPPTQEDAEAFARGVALRDFTCRPALLERTQGETECFVTISEGKFHQIKRMFAARQKDVRALKRLQIGSLVLDDALKPGEIRALTDREIADLKRLAGLIGANGRNSTGILQKNC